MGYIDIINYFIFYEGIDGLQKHIIICTARCCTGNTQTFFLFIFFKAEVEPNQKVSQVKHAAWVTSFCRLVTAGHSYPRHSFGLGIEVQRAFCPQNDKITHNNFGGYFNFNAASHARFFSSIFGIERKAYGAGHGHSFQVCWCSKHVFSRNF